VVTLTASSVESATAGVDAILAALFSAQNPPPAATFLVSPHVSGLFIYIYYYCYYLI
jgi:hypothetical protein